MVPTDEQAEIIALADDPSNLQIIAYAGCGKTSTLEMFDRTMLPGPRLCLAFNKRIAEEVAKRLSPTTECRTFNSLGHRIWAAAVSPKLVLDPKKTQNTFKEIVGALSKADRDAAWEEYGEICNAVNLAKGMGYIPAGATGWSKRLLGPEDFFSSLEDQLSHHAIEIANSILDTSIVAAYRGLIDFNDQLYMPALFGGSFPRFPCVLVDEAQDLSPINHEMLRKLRPPRLVAVGDPFQSIYQFRGAMQDGMAIQRSAFSMQTQRLSVSFRCPSEIVANARWRAPGFRSLVDGGTVSSLKELALESIGDGSAIICRNNAPLFALASHLLAAGRSCRVAGSDVGPKLISLLRRLGDDSLDRSAVLSSIDNWERKKGDSSTASDLAACMRIFANLGQTLKDAIAYAEHVLRQDGRVLLTTGHKAKGLEWETVYHLDPWLIGKSEQELNLRYVIQTRAREAYYEIDSRDIN
jgi:DNA helicase II / ATP-dependent DNA helicase PcrA